MTEVVVAIPGVGSPCKLHKSNLQCGQIKHEQCNTMWTKLNFNNNVDNIKLKQCGQFAKIERNVQAGQSLPYFGHWF